MLLIALATPNGQGQGLGPLGSVAVPKPTNLSKYVRDETALILLGKALFWDVQVSSDGRLACASCHFHAGADHRAQNQLINTTGAFAPNYTLTLGDYPFHKLADSSNNNSEVLRDTAQVAGSAGVFRRKFVEVLPGSAEEDGFDAGDVPAFSIEGMNIRQVTGRNSPSVINAVFYVRNFWDGRASNIFTGATPFGESDTNPNSLVTSNGRLVAEPVRIENSSLASQAVGPLLNSVEMSYDGRTWPKAGRKILSLRPLASQKVAPSDSILGRLAHSDGPGLVDGLSYLALVQGAFQPEYWNSPQVVDSSGGSIPNRTGSPGGVNEFTQAEWNFPLFWGLAIQAYEATLVSADSPFDRFSSGTADALSPVEQAGLALFRGRADCDDCHSGPEFTSASFTTFARLGAVQRRRNGVLVDSGFFRIGVRPGGEDIGLGGQDGFGRPLSAAVGQNSVSQQAVNGTFKVPTLRNVDLTGPYFHNGGQATLEQVMEFYSRGGDFPGGNGGGRGIRRLNLSADDRTALVAFLKSLTDDRVRYERAPFDHPELCVPIGHAEIRRGLPQPAGIDHRFPLSASDKRALLPAVGANGHSVPLQTFGELLEGIGADGSRAHNLMLECAQ